MPKLCVNGWPLDELLRFVDGLARSFGMAELDATGWPLKVQKMAAITPITDDLCVLLAKHLLAVVDGLDSKEAPCD